MSFNIKNFFSEVLPSSVSIYSDFPKYNFVGGHNSEESIPIDELSKSAEKVIKAEAP